MLRKIVFLEQFFGIAFLYIDQQQAKWVRLGRGSKNTSNNTVETDKEKIKERKQERKKKKIRSLKAVEKLVLPNPFLLINNKAPKVLDAQVEYIP